MWCMNTTLWIVQVVLALVMIGRTVSHPF